MSAALLLLRPDEEDRRRLAKLARLTYGRSGDRVEAELAGRLLSDVLTERLDMAARIQAARNTKAAA
jgi:hypothetical protein